ncbi:MAG: iron-containing alcohol dehydrogenase [Spirochaetales bacterium]|nr:iron-containing alcohol dehydrogenase [Spirochaetales bacterium]
MMNFEWNLPTKLNYAEGNLEKVGELSKQYGKKAFVVSYGNPGAGVWVVEKAIKSLEDAGVPYYLYDAIEPNPRVTTIDAGVQKFKEEGCDFLIGVGGGSVIDAGKYISATAHSGGSCWDYVILKERKEKVYTGAYPIIAVPTVAASGSEANAGGVITNWETNEKSFCRSEYRIPQVAIIDPQVFASLPRHITIDSSIDIFSHLIEHYLSSAAESEVADRMTEGMILTVKEMLDRVLANPEDLEARGQLSLCSILGWSGLQALGRTGSIPIHFIEHQMSGHFDISHGKGIAVVIPPYLAYFADARPDRWAKLARRCFDVVEADDNKAAAMLAPRVTEWFKSVDSYHTLTSVGIGGDHNDMLADDIIRMYGTLEGNKVPGARPMSREDIMNVLNAAV